MPKQVFSVFVGGESALLFRGPIGARGAVPPGTKCCQQPLRYKQSLEKTKRLRMEIVVDDDGGAAVVAVIYRADEPLPSSG